MILNLSIITNAFNYKRLNFKRFLPAAVQADTFKSMEAFVVASYSHIQWQLYLPSSFLATLKMVRMNFCLHFVRVFFTAIPYFLLLAKGVLSLFRYQYNSSGQPLSSLSTKHVRLTLEDLLAETFEEETVGGCANGPVKTKYILLNNW